MPRKKSQAPQPPTSSVSNPVSNPGSNPVSTSQSLRSKSSHFQGSGSSKAKNQALPRASSDKISRRTHNSAPGVKSSTPHSDNSNNFHHLQDNDSSNACSIRSTSSENPPIQQIPPSSNAHDSADNSNSAQKPHKNAQNSGLNPNLTPNLPQNSKKSSRTRPNSIKLENSSHLLPPEKDEHITPPSEELTYQRLSKLTSYRMSEYEDHNYRRRLFKVGIRLFNENTKEGIQFFVDNYSGFLKCRILGVKRGHLRSFFGRKI